MKSSVVAGLVLAAALAAMTALPFYDEPLTENEGAFTYILHEWTAGSTPYVQFPENKPPLGFLIYWLFGLGVPTEFQVRCGIAVLAALSAVLLGIFAGRRSPAAGFAAAIAFAVSWCWPPINAWVGNAETLMHLPLIAAAFGAWLFLTTSNRKWVWVAGISVGCASLIKQTAAVHLLWIWWAIGRGWRAPLFLFIGFLLPHVVFLGIFSHTSGVSPYLDALTAQKFSYYMFNVKTGVTGENLLFWIKEIPNRFSDIALMLIVAVWGSKITAKSTPHPSPPERPAVGRGLPPQGGKEFNLGWAWLSASVLMSVSGGIGRDYYFTPILGPVCFLFGLGASELYETLSSRKYSRWGMVLAGAAVCLPFLGSMIYLHKPAGDSFSDYVTRDLYPLSKKVGLDIRARTRPGDKIFVLAGLPQIFVYSERRSAVPYAWPGHYTADPKLNQAVEENLAAHPPAAIVIGYTESPPHPSPAMAHLLADTYIFEGSTHPPDIRSPSTKLLLYFRKDIEPPVRVPGK